MYFYSTPNVQTEVILETPDYESTKMWSKKWYLKGNISCDAHLLNELLENDVP